MKGSFEVSTHCISIAPKKVWNESLWWNVSVCLGDTEVIHQEVLAQNGTEAESHVLGLIGEALRKLLS